MKKLVLLLLLLPFVSFAQDLDVDKINVDVKKTLSYLDLEDLSTTYGHMLIGGKTEVEYTETMKKEMQRKIDYLMDDPSIAEGILYTYEDSELQLNLEKYARIYNEQWEANSYLSNQSEFIIRIIFLSLRHQIEFSRIDYYMFNYVAGNISKEKYESLFQKGISAIFSFKRKIYK